MRVCQESGTWISVVEAAHILDVSTSTVRRWMVDGVLDSDRPGGGVGLDRGRVEALAALRWPYRQGSRVGVDSYWATAPTAGRILDVSRARVGQLVGRGRLPFVAAGCGVRLFRRGQVQVIANARISRRLSR